MKKKLLAWLIITDLYFMSAVIDYQQLYEQSQATNASLQMQVLQLTQQLAQLKKMIYGSRQERFIPIDPSSPQLSLDIQTDPVAACKVNSARQISYIRSNTSVEPPALVHPGRMKLPDTLRRQQIILEPAEDITGCKKIGEE